MTGVVPTPPDHLEVFAGCLHVCDIGLVILVVLFIMKMREFCGNDNACSVAFFINNQLAWFDSAFLRRVAN